MAEELNLRKDLSQYKSRSQNTRDVLQDLLDSGEPGLEKERLELLENILNKSNVQFASIADKVSVDFNKFVHMLLTHDLAPLLDTLEKQKGNAKDPATFVVVSSDLLADISNCQKVEEEDEEEEVNILSGIFVYGIFSGIILSLVVAIVTKFINFHIGIRDLLLVLGGFIAVLLIPVALMIFEPSLKNMQKRHNEFFQRMAAFFSGKI